MNHRSLAGFLFLGVVWMPTYDAENHVRDSKESRGPAQLDARRLLAEPVDGVPGRNVEP